MSPEAYRSSIDYLAGVVIPSMAERTGRRFSSVNVSYVGGELLVVPSKAFADSVFYARDRLASSFGEVSDNGVTNLIGSPARVSRLVTLFGGDVHTSIDSFGDRRRVGGSADTYRKIFLRNYEMVSARKRVNLATVFMVDAVGVMRLIDEYREAQARKASLGLKFASPAGRGAVSSPASVTADAMIRLFDIWAMAADAVPVNPLNMVLWRVLERRKGLSRPGCPTSAKCAETALCLEPDGGLYLCQDMADNGAYPLGNALEQRFDWDVWGALRSRGSRVLDQCRGCDSFDLCEGGCLSRSIEEGKGLEGVSSLCAVWKALFERAEALVRLHGDDAVRSWLKGIAEGYVSLA